MMRPIQQVDGLMSENNGKARECVGAHPRAFVRFDDSNRVLSSLTAKIGGQ